MKFYTITGGKPLKGEITISGAKNSALKIIIASLLSGGKCVLSNIPKIIDVEITLDMCQALGAKYKWLSDDKIEIDSSQLNAYQIPLEYRDKLRVPILFFGPLLHRFGQAEIPSPGGCKIGKRPVDFHIEGLRALGAEIDYAEKFYIAKTNGLKGALIELPYPSVGATENLLISATLAKGKTVIKNAAIEPEIEDLAIFLQAMGAIIYQDINRTWVVEGVEKLHPSNYKVMGDRIEAASFGIAAIVTNGDIYVKGARQDDMLTFLNCLRKAGGEFEILSEGIRFYGNTSNLKAMALETDVHPGFMTDWQAPFVLMLTQVNGISVIHETVYEDRLGYTSELNKMGAQIQLYKDCLGGRNCRFANKDYSHSAVIVGPTKLHGTEVDVPDLRAGFSYILAALVAEGISKINNVEIIERGYCNIKEKLLILGVDLKEGETKS